MIYLSRKRSVFWLFQKLHLSTSRRQTKKQYPPRGIVTVRSGKTLIENLRQFENVKYYLETFEKCSIFAKVKESENFNHRNILNISRIEI